MDAQMFLDLLNGASMMAELNSIYFKQLKQHGFTDDQALELVKVMTITILAPKEATAHD